MVPLCMPSVNSPGYTLAKFSGNAPFATGLLHWFVSPYVHRLRYDPGNGWIEASRLDILARPLVTHFDISEAQYADTMRPQSTFKVRNGGVADTLPR